jgi:hypothetical protein
MKRPLLILAFALAATVFATGARARATGPCSILTGAEVSHYLGTSASGHLAGNQCLYRGLRGRNATLGVAVITGPTANAQFRAFEQDSHPVSGVGYQAHYAAGSIAAMKNGTVVLVTLILNAHEMTVMDPQLPTLARLVLGRI